MFKVDAVATYPPPDNSLGSTTSSPVYLQIANATPAPVSDFRLNPTDDTGIAGDNVTSDRTPSFIGTAPAGDTIELFQIINFAGTLTTGSASVTGTSGTTGLVAGASVNGTGIPSGTTILAVDSSTVITLSANATSTGSANLTATDLQNTGTAGLTGTLTSGSPSVTGISSTAGLVVGESITGAGIPSGTTILSVSSSAATITLSANATVSGSQSLSASTPANVIPFQGDFDGDSLTDLAYYNPSTATWVIEDSQSQTASSFPLGTPNLSIPVVGYFAPNGGQLNQIPQVGTVAEPAVFTYANGQDTWTIDSSTQGIYTVTFPQPGQAGDIPVPGDYDDPAEPRIGYFAPWLQFPQEEVGEVEAGGPSS
jgi:hypothetical protein